jgi:hypothetical protein
MTQNQQDVEENSPEIEAEIGVNTAVKFYPEVVTILLPYIDFIA